MTCGGGEGVQEEGAPVWSVAFGRHVSNGSTGDTSGTPAQALVKQLGGLRVSGEGL